MSVRDQNVRFRFQALSELPTVIAQLEQINQLTEQQGKAASSSADIVKAALLQQRNDTKATAEENLAISKEIARQTTLEKKAQLDQQTAQLKASEAQQTAFVQASEKERAVLAEQIAKQSTNEQQAELKRQEILLAASEAQKTAILKSEEERRTAAVRAALLEQAQAAQALQEQATLELKSELNRQTLAYKSEADQQTAIVRAEQQRQTLLLRGELDEQKTLLRQQGAAYQELRNFIASAFGAYEIVQFGKDVVEAKSKIDIFRTGLQQMIGTKKEADEVFVKLVEMAKTTPFQVENLMEATFSLKAMGTATEELLPTLNALGNMAAVVGSDKLGFIAKAFTDIQNKGKLMKQELNQFADNGVPLYDLLAVSMGKTREEVIKLADAHEISFAQVKKAIFDASSEGGRYYNLMGLQAATLGGQVSNLADKFFLAKAKLGDYFENGLQKIITGLSNLTEELGGSDSAITRNVAIVKAAVAAWLTYQGVVNATAIVEGALAAATVVKNGAMAAGQVIYGAYLLVVRAATFGLIEMTTAEMEATIATRAFGAAIAANPLGVIIALLGAAATAYYAYEAASVEVTTQLGEEQLKLASEQKNLNAVAEAAMSAAMGTRQRIDYINILKREWPDYFRGIDSEKVTNAELKTILDKVNTSYSARISLARQAYKLEGLQDEMKKNLQKEAEILAALPADLQAKYGGSITKAVADLFANPKIFDKINTDWKGQLGFGDFSFDEAKKVSDNLERIGKKMVEVDTDIAKSQTARITTAERAENARWEAELKGLKKGSDEYKKEEQKHEDALSKIREDAQKKEVAALVGHTGKMKDITLNSQKTIKDILLNNDEMSYKDKVKYYENLEALEIEQVNKTRVSTKASEAELVALRKDALEKIQGIKEKYASIQTGLAIQERKEMSDTINLEIVAFQKRNDGQQDYITKTTTGFKQIADAAKVRQKAEVAAEKDVQQEREKTIKLMEQASDVEEKTRRKIIGLIADFTKNASPMLAEITKGVLSVIDNVDVLSGKTLQTSQKQLDEAQNHLTTIKAIYDAGIGGTAKDVEKAKQAVAESKKDVAEASLQTAQTVFAVMGAIYQVFSAIASAYNQMMAETYKAVANGLKLTLEKYKEFYDDIQKTAESAYKEDLKNFTGSLEEKLKLITDYYAKEKEFAEGNDRVEATLNYYQKLAQLQADAGTDAGKIIEGLIRLQADKLQEGLRNEIAAAERSKLEAADVRDAKIDAIDAAHDAFVEKINEQIDLLQQQSDAEKAVLEQQLDDLKANYDLQVTAVKDAYDRQLAALKDKESQERDEIQATYDLKQQLLEQATADQVEEIAILDRVRNEALERYRADEIARITATRDRILATLTDEGERAQVTAAYEQQLKDLHDTVEAAKLDKSKGVSLATTQLNKEAKDEAERLKTEEKETLARLEDEYQAKFAQLAADRDALLTQMKADELAREQVLKDQIANLEKATADKIEALQNQIRDNEISTSLQKKVAQQAYADAVKQLNIQIFEANKQLLIEELKAEVAVLEAKKNIFNQGTVTAAQNQIIAVINQLTGQSSGIAPVSGIPEQVSGPNSGTPIYDAYTKDGKKVVISYSAGHNITVYDANGNEIKVKDGIGFVPETGQYFAKGTESVSGPYPDGVDTVPAWLTKGERVLTVEQNKLLGDISNEELVLRHQFLQSLDLGSIGPKISLPDGVVSSDGTTASLDFSELTGEMRKTRKAIENQKLMNISIDRNGFSVSEEGKQSVVKHFEAILKR